MFGQHPGYFKAVFLNQTRIIIAYLTTGGMTMYLTTGAMTTYLTTGEMTRYLTTSGMTMS
jgi:hypothetical protein